MARKENQRIVLTRRLLQEGLLRLLATQKLEDISVTALCKESGINRATFYNHYSSPVQLLQEMEEGLVSELLRLAPPSSSVEETLRYTEKCCELLQDNAALFDILVRYHIDQNLEDFIHGVTQHYAVHRVDLGKVHMDPATMRLVSSYLYTGCYALVREWLVNHIDKTPKEIATLLVDIINKNYL